MINIKATMKELPSDKLNDPDGQCDFVFAEIVMSEPLVDAVVAELRSLGATVQTGRFRTHMQVELVNDGPVTVTVEV